MPPPPTLYRAAKKGDTITIRQLLSAGHDPNEETGFGMSVLAVAAERGDVALIHLLLDYGAKPDSYALEIAAFRGHAEAVRCLMAAGASVMPHSEATSPLKMLDASGMSSEQVARMRAIIRESGTD